MDASSDCEFKGPCHKKEDCYDSCGVNKPPFNNAICVPGRDSFQCCCILSWFYSNLVYYWLIKKVISKKDTSEFYWLTIFFFFHNLVLKRNKYNDICCHTHNNEENSKRRENHIRAMYIYLANVFDVEYEICVTLNLQYFLNFIIISFIIIILLTSKIFFQLI